MNNFFKYIISIILLFSFSVSAMGLEINLHFCSVHKVENIAFYHLAKCPCHHSCDSKCEHSNHHNDHSVEHYHDLHNPEYSDDSCTHTDIKIVLKDAYSPSNFKVPTVKINELYTLPKFEFIADKLLNKIQNIEINKLNHILQKPKIFHHSYIYNLSSKDDIPDSFIN